MFAKYVILLWVISSLDCFLKVNSQQPSRSCLAGIQACYQSGIARIASNIRDPEFICKQKRSFLVCVLTPNCPATFDRGYASVIEKLDNYFSLVKYPCPYTKEDALEELKRNSAFRQNSGYFSVILSGFLILALRSFLI